jgi:hypothetical protein
MTAYPVMAICAGYILNSIMKQKKNPIVSMIIIYVLINIFIVYTERDFYIDLRDTYVQLSYDLEDNSVLIVYQAVKPIKNIYAANLRVEGIHSDYQEALAEKTPGYVSINLTDILRNNDTVYLLESGVVMPDDHLKLLFGKFTKNQGAKVKGFALDKVLSMNSSFQPEKLKNYPLDVYKLTKMMK